MTQQPVNDNDPAFLSIAMTAKGGVGFLYGGGFVYLEEAHKCEDVLFQRRFERGCA
jgi:hypothetical protein